MRWTAAGLAALAVLALAACEKGEECEKARLAAANSWEEVKNQAGKTKFQDTVSYEGLSGPQKAEHHAVWSEIETQSALVFDSFAFQKITWNSAKNGRDKVQKAFDGYEHKHKYSSFSTMLQSAYKRYDAAEAACR